MSFRTWADSKIKRCNWIDVQFIKLSVVSCILMIAKLWKPLLSLDWYWYAIISVLSAIKPVHKALRK
ncbi:MAG: hypothetical protein QMD71_07200 [bacterium]|nr:hypothetical protein [bacterium]